jgi:hypothetical protein
VPTGKLYPVTVTEAARALNVNTPDYVYRLIRCGVLAARKVDGPNGPRWDIDPESVEQRKLRVALKASSKLNAQAERGRRMAEAEAMFA